MQGLILAAGMGRRLGRLTQDNTKCMVEVNGVRLIDRMLTQLAELGIGRTTIVIGYSGANLRAFVGSEWKGMKIEYIENPIYDKTNNIYSLSLASDVLCADDTLLLESDIILEDGILRKMVDSPYPNVVCVDAFKNWMDGTVVTLGDDGLVREFIGKADFDFSKMDSYYKTVNVYRFSREFSERDYVPFLKAYSKSQGNNEYYEQVLKMIVLLGKPMVHALSLSGEKWYEIDDVQDLDIAESMFCAPAEQIRRLSSRYGGYWRYPGLKDFCYLVNPGYPGRRLREEMRAVFDELLESYPSGQRVNALLAGKLTGLPEGFMVVGNGAAELIKAYMDTRMGKIGFVYPTFEEYPNRVPENRRVVFTPDKAGFRYSADDLVGFFSGKGIGTLVLVNPDNPSGNLMSRDDVWKMSAWAAKEKVSLLLDESFIDFADEPYTCLDEDFLVANPHVAVMKSISKSYGVPGVRLGFLATGDASLVAEMRKAVAIWNVNSYGEYFLQICGKYEREYRASCHALAEERNRFAAALGGLPFLTVWPSAANFLLVEVKSPFTPQGISEMLLRKHSILVKACGTKKGFSGRPFLRIAVRGREDNDVLVDALKEMSTSGGAAT